jgi:hypothetical protein
MSFTWHGESREDGLLWERKVIRRKARLLHHIDIPIDGQMMRALNEGSTVPLNKAETRRFLKDGVHHMKHRYWSTTGRKFIDIEIALGDVLLVEDVELTTLHRQPLDPMSVQPPKRKKK